MLCNGFTVYCLGERYYVTFCLVAWVSPSVCLSVVCDVCAPFSEGWTFRQYFAPCNSLGTRAVCVKFWRKKINRVLGEMEGAMKNLRFSASSSLYFEDDTGYGRRYNRRRIGTRMRSIEWCHFQWPWLTRNLDFKVTPIFSAEYVINEAYKIDTGRQWITSKMLHTLY